MSAQTPSTGREPARRADPASLRIAVTSGTGVAPTALAAFDVALQVAGIANFNLIPLSSVIPPGSVVEVPSGGRRAAGEWGDRLYVVLAATRVEKHNEEAWAGIGWSQEASTGRGVFVEHHGFSEHQVRADIEASLKSLVERRPEVDLGEHHSVVRGIVCEGEPVCALVAASFLSTGWEYPDTIDLR